MSYVKILKKVKTMIESGEEDYMCIAFQFVTTNSQYKAYKDKFYTWIKKIGSIYCDKYETHMPLPIKRETKIKYLNEYITEQVWEQMNFLKSMKQLIIRLQKILHLITNYLKHMVKS